MIHEYNNIEKFDVISDIHGCYDSLMTLIEKLGYQKNNFGFWVHEEGRTIVLAGDIMDRGPNNLDSIGFAIDQCLFGRHIWVEGNHCNKFKRYLLGNPIVPGDGLKRTISEVKFEYTKQEKRFIGRAMVDKLPTKIVLDDQNVIIAHAQPPAKDANTHVYGEHGIVDRRKWWKDYDGDQFAVFGHYWMNDPEPRDNWCCVDTSCCKGGELTAFRWPEKQIVQVESL